MERQKRGYEGVLFPLVVFILIGTVLAGVESPEPVTEYITINSECNDYGGLDDDSDGSLDLVEDEGCQSFPYSSGNGEAGTNPNAVDTTLNYQPFYDLTVDYVRDFVTKACGGNLAGCVGTNYQNEVQFYCYFSSNMMGTEFFDMFDKHFNDIQYLPDDGSITAFLNTCQTLPPSPTTLLLIEYQASSPIPVNQGGSGGK